MADEPPHDANAQSPEVSKSCGRALDNMGLSSTIADGTLVEVMPDFRPPLMPVSLAYPNRRNLPVRVQVFMNWMAGLMPGDLERGSGE